jgi:hypothetical protein
MKSLRITLILLIAGCGVETPSIPKDRVFHEQCEEFCLTRDGVHSWRSPNCCKCMDGADMFEE